MEDPVGTPQDLNEAASNIIGYISLACWMVVMFPQIYLNYTRKSGEGVSITTVVSWVVGDIFNIAGALMQNLVMSTILIGSYYLFVDSTLLFQMVYYRVVYKAHLLMKSADSDHSGALERASSEDPAAASLIPSASYPQSCEPELHSAGGDAGCRQPWYKNKAIVFIASMVSIVIAGAVFIAYSRGTSGLDDQGPHKPTASFSKIIAQVMGMASAIVYIMSYVPQAVQNYRRKSTEGLSIWLFILSLAGNATYALAILVVSLDPKYLAPYVPWLLGAIVPCSIQVVILYQFKVYSRYDHSHQPPV